MEAWNAADLIGILFLAFGIWDGFRKGLIKKGTSLVITLVTLLVVYMASPYVEDFFQAILPSSLSVEKLAGTDSQLSRLLVLSGLDDVAENYLTIIASRILAVVVTYIVARILLRTLVFSLEILTKVPGLSLLNRLLGAGVGGIQQILTIWLFFLLLAVFGGTGWGAALCQLIQESAYMSWFFENNLLLLTGLLLILKI